MSHSLDEQGSTSNDSHVCIGCFHADTVRAPFCDAVTYVDCFFKEVDSFWTNKTLQDSCSCSPMCTRRIYDASISMSYFPSDDYAEMLQIATDRGDIESYRKNYLELKLYYSAFMYDNIVQEPIYTFESIIATLGGQMGLFIGMSILSIVEVAEMIFNLLHTGLFKVLGNNKTYPEKS